jgi:hypothetical protein
MPKSKTAKARSNRNNDSPPSSSPPETNTLSSLRADQQLWYKICVLVYDLRNLSKDRTTRRNVPSAPPTSSTSAPRTLRQPKLLKSKRPSWKLLSATHLRTPTLSSEEVSCLMTL